MTMSSGILRNCLSGHMLCHMRLSIILDRLRILSVSWAQPRCSAISKIARTRRLADCVINTMSDMSAKPSSFNCEM